MNKFCFKVTTWRCRGCGKIHTRERYAEECCKKELQKKFKEQKVNYNG